MFYASYIDADGQTVNNLYDRHEDFHRDTFSPDCVILNVIDLKITGHGYQERKQSAEELAIEFSHADTSGLSYYETWLIQTFFRGIGKRYGLLREFEENCIC